MQRLALDTLADVQLGSLDRLLAFVHECVLPLLANAEAVRVRRAAAQAATCVLRRYLAGQQDTPKNGHASSKVCHSPMLAGCSWASCSPVCLGWAACTWQVPASIMRSGAWAAHGHANGHTWLQVFDMHVSPTTRAMS